MRRWNLLLAGALCAQLLIAGALSMRHDALANTAPDTPLLGARAGGADRIVIEAPAPTGGSAPQRVELLRRGKGWVVHSAWDVPASRQKVEDLLSRLASLRRGLPIADTADALDRFEVDHRHFDLRLSLSRTGKTFATLYLGKSAGLRKTDARLAGERAVYTVGIDSYSLPADAARWTKADLLQVSEDRLATIAVEGIHGGRIDLARDLPPGKPAGPWKATGLGPGHTLDTAKADALARGVAELRVSKVLGTAADPDWRFDAPAAKLTIGDTSGSTATWTLAKPKSGDFVVLKSSTEPWYFQLTDADAAPLLAAAAPGGLDAAAAKAVRPAPHRR
ncbi:MAG: DUF4340 domain-containing protein [Gammaproteobacteria bacterium]|nr:DUF4340 domain-containing protein [Gammaproteobacteria bacterium]